MDIIKGKEIVVEIARLLTPVERVRVRGIESISVNGVEQEVIDHSVDIAIPTKTSQLTNDSNFATSTDVNSKVSKSGDTMSGALQLPIMTLHDSMANTSATFTMSGDKVVITFD